PDYLRENKITNLYVCGLTTDYCVKASAIDSINEGFHTYVITDAVKPVNANPGDDKKALQEMYQAGCILINSDDVVA
ncbi:MAG: isochorismatase family protein, partial [Bacteroidia bacterium]|nr:isochorismatase family protein [Bacteroidia bacterium]